MVKELKNKTMLRQAQHDKKRNAKCEMRYGFTLLELLLVIAIIAVLAGIIMFSLKPADRLREANQTKYLSNANDLEKAFNSYVVDNGGNLPATFNSLTYGYYDICRQGQSGSCVSLDELVTSGKMSSIPVDSDNQTATTTGFKVRYDPVKKEAMVYSNSEYTNRINSGTTLTEGVVGWWKMDETSWSGAAGEVRDSSPFNNHGRTYGSMTPGIGKYANGGLLDGVNDYIRVEDNNSLDLGTVDFSVSIFFKTASAVPDSNGTRLIKKGYSSTDVSGIGWELRINQNNKPQLCIGYWTNQQCPEFTTANAVNDNFWHNVVFGIDKINNKIYGYLDGILVINGISITYLSSLDNSIPLYIGTHYGSSQMFTGQLDEARVYNRLLNADEARALYEYAPSAIAHWKFDEGAGTTGKDFSSQNPDLTFAGTPTWTNDCKVSNCINFDTDQTDYASFTVPGNSPFNMGAQDFSVSSWVKIPQPTTYGSGVFGRYPHNTSYNGNWVIGILDDRVTYFFGHRNTTGTIAFWNGINFSSYFGKWTHSEWVKSGSNMYLFINGVQVSSWVLTNPFDITFSGVPFYFSNTSWSPGEMNGLVIDEFKLYNYARTQAQVVKDMNNN